MVEADPVAPLSTISVMNRHLSRHMKECYLRGLKPAAVTSKLSSVRGILCTRYIIDYNKHKYKSQCHNIYLYNSVNLNSVSMIRAMDTSFMLKSKIIAISDNFSVKVTIQRV